MAADVRRGNVGRALINCREKCELGGMAPRRSFHATYDKPANYTEPLMLNDPCCIVSMSLMGFGHFEVG